MEIHDGRPASSPGRDVLAALSARSHYPRSVHLQVADRCNHACVHCYQVQGEKGELSLEQVRRVLDDLAAAGVLVLNVSGGEATLRADLVPILEHARARGFAIRLYTNAFAMTDELAAAVARVGVLEVHVSVYSDRPEQHDAITGVPGSLARTLSGVRALRARGVRVCLKTPVLALARGSMAGVVALAAALGCEHETATDLTAREDGALVPLEHGMADDDLAREGLARPWLPGASDARLRDEKLAAASCGVCTSGAVVHPNGDVMACTDTPVRLGNVLETSLPELYANSPDVPLFRELTWSQVHGCRDCDLFLACHRCHATALNQQGDYLGPYRQACGRARARYAAGLGHGVQIEPAPPGTEPARDPTLGPYAIVGPGVLRPIADRQRADDLARARAHPWIRGGAAVAVRTDGDAGAVVPVASLRQRAATRRATARDDRPNLDEKGR